MEALEGQIEGVEPGVVGENGVKLLTQSALGLLTRSPFERLELLIEPPDLVTDGRLGGAGGVTQGEEGVNRALRMNPT